MATGDAAFREAERAYAAAPNEEALARLNLERRRRGFPPVHLNEQTVAVLASSGAAEATSSAAPGKQPNKLTTDSAEPIVTAYLRAGGYTYDRWQALVSADGTRRFKFKARVTEEYTGGSGHWNKVRSLSTIGFATSLLARARSLAGLEGTKIKEKRQKEKSKRATRAAEAAVVSDLRDKSLRLAILRISSDMTPQDRNECMFCEDRDMQVHARGLAQSFVGEVEAPTTAEEIDRLFSLDEPPFFLVALAKGVTYPKKFELEDPEAGHVALELGRDQNRASVSFGGLPVDPETGSFDPMRGILAYGGHYNGLSATFTRTGAALFMFKPRDKSHGLALLRAFCRLLRAYNLRYFSLGTLTEDEVEFIVDAKEAGEITLIRDANDRIYARCERVGEDARQRRFFPDQNPYRGRWSR